VSNEAFDWFVLLAAWFALLGAGAFIGMVWESWAEWRRERNQRLPEPNCRARVVRRWGVPE
jgi:hypothetical protein